MYISFYVESIMHNKGEKCVWEEELSPFSYCPAFYCI